MSEPGSTTSKKRVLGLTGKIPAMGLPHEPMDLPPRLRKEVLKRVRNADLHNLCAVNRAHYLWIMDNQCEVWKGRCEILHQPEDTGTVLGQCAKKTREIAAQAHRGIELFGRSVQQLARLRDAYHTHYRTWSPQIHPSNIPGVLDETCSHPDSWRLRCTPVLV